MPRNVEQFSLPVEEDTSASGIHFSVSSYPTNHGLRNYLNYILIMNIVHLNTISILEKIIVISFKTYK